MRLYELSQFVVQDDGRRVPAFSGRGEDQVGEVVRDVVANGIGRGPSGTESS